MAIKLHMHVETKIEGRWEHYTALEIPNTGELENIILFAAINHTLVDKVPEGIMIRPACRINYFSLDDMSPVTKKCFKHENDNEVKMTCGILEHVDIHNLGDRIWDAGRVDFDEVTGIKINGYNILDTKSHGFENIRILFWFTGTYK